MWDDQDQTRWNELSRKRDYNKLSETEQREYDSLAALLEAEEWEQLSPALRDLHRETLIMKDARRAAERALEQLNLLLSERREANQRFRLLTEEVEREYHTAVALRQRSAKPVASGVAGSQR